MDKRSNVLQLVEDNNEQSLKELITKHGASVLTAPYEHKDNEFGWPSFGVSFVLFKMSGSECRCVCVCVYVCVCVCVCVKKKKKKGIVTGQNQPLRAVWCNTRLLNSGGQFDQTCNLFGGAIPAQGLC